MKKFNLWIILIILVYGFIELTSYSGLLFVNKYKHINYEPIDTISTKQQKSINRSLEQKSKYVSYSSTLGWTIKKNGTSKLYQANSAAIRSDREYAITPPRGVRRISTFGDSFTHGDDVKNNETWQAAMESYDSNIEVLNFGVSGFGLDQAYLRYLEKGPQFQPNIVLIGFMSENFRRTVNTYRPFLYPKTGLPFTKPRFLIKDGELSLIPNPIKTSQDYKKLLLHPREVLPKIGVNDYYYKRHYTSSTFDWSPTVRLTTLLIQNFKKKSTIEDIMINGRYNEKSEAFKVTKKIFDEFYNLSITNQSTPIILVFPELDDIKPYRRDKKKPYSILLSYFDSVGYKYIDLMGAFENVDIKDLFGEKHHYSPLANKLAAKYILNYINNTRNLENSSLH